MLQLMRMVQLEPSNYYKVINHLRQDKRMYSDIVAVLDTEYFGTKKLPVSTLPAGQTGNADYMLIALA